ncbi:MAG: glycerophosphodiester phosphodiesterase [Actinomycetia bacterium]|nr:glycerophosphodiester phosphodiesterase [Actinomycetes bacterium]MCP4224492.1 glycerophosphodiester phosphodiesterase [Actinomycetes bacterium]MCP5031145.1 glycerophosphodiester phosphodiesterase [Actinomycetes bacterium]
MQWAFLDHPIPFGFAHQGGSDIAPGNTEASFQHAVSLGYGYIETDVQATADGVLVVFHDDDLESKTGHKGKVKDLSSLELADLRVEGEHPIPRFEDMVERFPTIRFNVEPKTDEAVDPLIDLIRRRKLEDQICIGSFSDRRLGRFRRRLGSPPVCTSPAPRGVIHILLAALLGKEDIDTPYGALQIPESYFGIPLTRSWLVSRVKRLGLQVHVWTINDEADMNRILDAGVDAIMTDRVTLLRDVLVGRSQSPEADERPPSS